MTLDGGGGAALVIVVVVLDVGGDGGLATGGRRTLFVGLGCVSFRQSCD